MKRPFIVQFNKGNNVVQTNRSSYGGRAVVNCFARLQPTNIAHRMRRCGTSARALSGQYSIAPPTRSTSSIRGEFARRHKMDKRIDFSKLLGTALAILLGAWILWKWGSWVSMNTDRALEEEKREWCEDSAGGRLHEDGTCWVLRRKQ